MTEAVERLAYRINEVVEKLGVNRRLVERRIADGTLPVTRRLGVPLIPASAVERLLNDGLPAPKRVRKKGLEK